MKNENIKMQNFSICTFYFAFSLCPGALAVV